MTPEELYARDPEKIVNPFDMAKDYMTDYLISYYYNHIEEINLEPLDICYVGSSDKVEIRIYKDFNFDSRRFWRLCSVWFENEPIMIIQNAGREGDDHAERYITDRVKYREMITHIESLIRLKLDLSKLNNDVIEANSDVPALTSFYGNALDEPFERY